MVSLIAYVYITISFSVMTYMVLVRMLKGDYLTSRELGWFTLGLSMGVSLFMITK